MCMYAIGYTRRPLKRCSMATCPEAATAANFLERCLHNAPRQYMHAVAIAIKSHVPITITVYDYDYYSHSYYCYSR